MEGSARNGDELYLREKPEINGVTDVADNDDEDDCNEYSLHEL